jgi:hypothetical protein
MILNDKYSFFSVFISLLDDIDSLYRIRGNPLFYFIFFEKKKNSSVVRTRNFRSLCRVPVTWHSAKSPVFAECRFSGTRQRRRHGPKHHHGYFSLPSACLILGKDVFAGIFATECPLPSVFGALPSVPDTRQRF